MAGGRKPRARATVNVSIDVPDLEAGLRFYASVFGFAETARPFPTMAILDGNNVTVCMHAKPAGSRSSPAGADVRRYERHWTPVHLDIIVTDIEPARARALAAGARPESDITDHLWGRMALLADPFGHGVCLIQFTGRGYDAIATG